MTDQTAGITSDHFTDGDGNPDGGQTYGTGLAIAWQRGPLAGDVGADECIFEHDDEGQADEGLHIGVCRRAPNGAFVENVIAAALDRLSYYETTKFSCFENRDAIRHLEEALAALGSRTNRRRHVGREGTHEADPEPEVEVRSLGQVADRQHLRQVYSWVGEGPVWVTRPSGSTEGPLNFESAIDILLAEPLSVVRVVDPSGEHSPGVLGVAMGTPGDD